MSAEPLEGEIIMDNGYEVRDNTLVAAGRWRRYAARAVDNMAIGFVCSLFFNIYCGLFVAFLLDAVVYALFKNTFGKWLFGEKVVDSATFLPLSGTEYFKRDCWVLVSGFGLGIPLIGFITMLRQFLRLGRGEAASYDQGNGWRVVVASPSPLKTAFGIFLILLMFMGIIVMFLAAVVAAADAATNGGI